MSKLKIQMKSKAQMTKLKREKVLMLSHFDIHLTFACLPKPRRRQGFFHLDLIGQRSG
jgi:hypothetical protein